MKLRQPLTSGTTLPSGQRLFFFTRQLVSGACRRIAAGLKRKNTYVEFICTLLIVLFIYTGLNKIMDLDKFKFEMGRSPFIQDISGFIAYALPAGELLLVLALIIKRTRLLGLYLSFSLMALFTGYIWLMLNYAWDLPCSCGGIISKLSWRDHLVFNAVFTVLTMIGVILQSNIIRDNKKPIKNRT